MRQIIFDAIRKKLCVKLIYHTFDRVVEPHTFGNNTAYHDSVRVWQVCGGSVSNEPIGWKMLLLSEMLDVQLLDEVALSPRPGYRQGDRGMRVIYCQV